MIFYSVLRQKNQLIAHSHMQLIDSNDAALKTVEVAQPHTNPNGAGLFLLGKAQASGRDLWYGACLKHLCVISMKISFAIKYQQMWLSNDSAGYQSQIGLKTKLFVEDLDN